MIIHVKKRFLRTDGQPKTRVQNLTKKKKQTKRPITHLCLLAVVARRCCLDLVVPVHGARAKPRLVDVDQAGPDELAKEAPDAAGVGVGVGAARLRRHRLLLFRERHRRAVHRARRQVLVAPFRRLALRQVAVERACRAVVRRRSLALLGHLEHVEVGREADG